MSVSIFPLVAQINHTICMEFFQVFSLLIIVYVFIRFLPRRGRLAASIPLIMVISFTYQSAIMTDITNSFIQLYNSGTIFYAQMIICFSLAFMVEISLWSTALKSSGPMEFSQFLDFFRILIDSIKLVPKNGKLMGFVATLSLLVPSILFSLFKILYQYLAISYDNTIPMIYVTYLLVPTFLLACSVIFQLSAIAAILVSAAAYSDHSKLSLSDLFSKIKTNWTRQLSNSFSRSRNPTRFELVSGAILNGACVWAIGNIGSSALQLIFYMDQGSAVWPLSTVVSVMEESSNGGEAQEKAGRLVEGQRVHGFILKLLFLMALVYSLIVGGQFGVEIHLTRTLLLLNLLSVGKILWWILHVGLYFQYMKEKVKTSDALGIGQPS